MKVGVIRFPGSNCDRDIFRVLRDSFALQVKILSHRISIEEKYELLVLPGGFSYGDYLRAGAIACFAPIIESLRSHIAQGRAVLGICNGFQILCEAGFLPGALLPNRKLRHICRDVNLSANPNNLFASYLENKSRYSIPISHSEGNYYAEKAEWEKMEERNQVVFRYQEKENPNGSLANIAGISDPTMRILGMMPHPERAVGPLTGKTDGKAILQSILNAL